MKRLYRISIIPITIIIVTFLLFLVYLPNRASAYTKLQINTPTRMVTNTPTPVDCNGIGIVKAIGSANLRKLPASGNDNLFFPRKYFVLDQTGETYEMDELCNYYHLKTGEWIHKSVVVFTAIIPTNTPTVTPVIITSTPKPTSTPVIFDVFVYHCESECWIRVTIQEKP